MNDRHDVIVIGGGIMGSTALFELARRGVDALLLESDPSFGGRDSSKTAGIIRTHYSNPEVVRMSIRGREIFRDFPRLTGAAPVLHEIGYVFMASPATLEQARANVAMQRAQGAEVLELPPAEFWRFAPGATPDGIAALFHEPGSGYADPVPAAVGFIGAAVRAGADAHAGVRVERLLRERDRVIGVATPQGDVLANDVVLAAGA